MSITVGEKFGRWTVTGESYMKDPGHRAIPCRCDCGTERTVLVFQLRNGRSVSCGCWKREDLAARKPRTSHGQRQNPLYQLWLRINRRCHNPEAHNYRWYGGRGIKVWEPWRHDAAAFIAYVELNLGPRPLEKTPGGAWVYSLDRIDNNGDYAPGNLRWATQFTQVHNRS